MDLSTLEALKCELIECGAFAEGADAADLLDLLKQHEGEIISGHTREGHPDPLASLQKRLGNVSLRHPALQPEVYDYAQAGEEGYDPLSRPGAGLLDYFPADRWVRLGQNINFPDEDDPKAVKIERVGIGLLQFLYHFAPLLKPAYAYVCPRIDPEFDPSPGDEFRQNGAVNYLCWANYFGPALVHKAGEEFFRTAPVWQSVRLATGGFLCVVTQSFLDWHFGKHLHHLRYFRQTFPGIEEF